MSDYERAVDALKKAGATDITSPFEDECWSLNKEPVDWLISPDEASGDARLVINLSDIPALLNPITPLTVAECEALELAILCVGDEFIVAVGECEVSLAEKLARHGDTLRNLLARHSGEVLPTPNPITPEKVEKAVREALQECESHGCCAAKGLAEAILTRLLKEEQS